MNAHMFDFPIPSYPSQSRPKRKTPLQSNHKVPGSQGLPCVVFLVFVVFAGSTFRRASDLPHLIIGPNQTDIDISHKHPHQPQTEWVVHFGFCSITTVKSTEQCKNWNGAKILVTFGFEELMQIRLSRSIKESTSSTC
jgi:hypothetical protein